MPDAPELTELSRTEDSIRYRLNLAADHPIFVGHFPGQPILPGVGQLYLITKALTGSLDVPVTWTGLDTVRFRKPIEPGVACLVDVALPDATGKVSFRIEREATSEAIAEGRFTVVVATREGAAHG